jgi:hypothetical protein
MDTRFASRESGARTQRLLGPVVIGLWVTVLFIICCRVALLYPQHDVFVTYLGAGREWIKSQALYSTTRGFVYSPLIAGCFALFSWLPERLGAILWRFLNAAALLWAMSWWLKMGLHHRIPGRSFILVFLLLLPLSIGNLNNGQVNPLVIGLLMMAILSAYSERWLVSALCLAISAYLKVYPLSVGLLLLVIYPRQLAWRLAGMLILLGALSFILQEPGYVLEQYQRWFATRAADSRRMNMDIAPRDFVMVLKALHINLSGHAIVVLQVLAGAAVAALCGFGRLRKWPEERLLVCVFTLGSCWMLLFGPTTEDATYVMLAPPLVLALVHAFHEFRLSWMRIPPSLSYAILLLGLAANSFLGLKKSVYSMSVQPFGALVFAVYAIIWTLISSAWGESKQRTARLPAPPGATTDQ